VINEMAIPTADENKRRIEDEKRKRLESEEEILSDIEIERRKKSAHPTKIQK
jgi:hypothetical protein